MKKNAVTFSNVAPFSPLLCNYIFVGGFFLDYTFQIGGGVNGRPFSSDYMAQNHHFVYVCVCLLSLAFYFSGYIYKREEERK